MLPPGTRFGRYEIRSVLGAGGMGVVYRAHDTQLERDVALKMPSLESGGNPELWDRLVREARLAAKIHHPNVCPIFDAGRIEDKYFMAMALIEGRPLTDLLQDRRLEPWEAAGIVAKIARALEAVHALGIIHRDVKPSNVMLNDAGEPILMDFGLARPIDREVLPIRDGEEPAVSQEPSLTQPGRPLGTPAYMSPEQVRGGAGRCAAADIYSLGVLFFQLLTGRLPFEGSLPEVLRMAVSVPPPCPRDLRSGLDPRLAAICRKAMSKEPADRHATARDLGTELESYLSRLAGTRRWRNASSRVGATRRGSFAVRGLGPRFAVD